MDTPISKYRFLLVAAVILLVILSVSQYSKLTINPSFNDYIPSEVGNRVYLKKLDSIFWGSEKIMLILTKDSDIINQESYTRIQRLSTELQELKTGKTSDMKIKQVNFLKKLDAGYFQLIPTAS